MPLSAERITIANHAVQRTIERTSVVWQAIPRWETGDPAQQKVRTDATFAIDNRTDAHTPPLSGDPIAASATDLATRQVAFSITLGQATAATHDALLAAVIPRTAHLAHLLDCAVLEELSKPARTATAATPWLVEVDPKRTAKPDEPDPSEVVLEKLIRGRELLEDSGYRAPSCLIVSTTWLSLLHHWKGSYTAYEGLLGGANVNAVYRATQLGKVENGKDLDLMLMIGRSAEIEPGRAGEASPGEEPIDLAISVSPSLEVIGEDARGWIELIVRVRFAVRFKDQRGVVVFHRK